MFFKHAFFALSRDGRSYRSATSRAIGMAVRAACPPRFPSVARLFEVS